MIFTNNIDYKADIKYHTKRYNIILHMLADDVISTCTTIALILAHSPILVKNNK